MTDTLEAKDAGTPTERLAQDARDSRIEATEALGRRVLAAALVGVDRATAAKLDEPLDAGRVRKKPGSGYDYLAEHDVIRTANRIFGYGRWGTEVVEHELIGAERVKNSRGEEGWYVGYRCTVRLTVAGCLPVDGVGYGDAFEKQWSGAITAHELAAKEAESDAIKRAFKKWGDQFGLILYATDDERRRIAAEKHAEEQAAEAERQAQPAAATLIAELRALAETKGKGAAVEQAIADKAAEGGLPTGWAERQLARLRTLPDATAGEGNTTDTAREALGATEKPSGAAAQVPTTPEPQSASRGSADDAGRPYGWAAADGPSAPDGDRWATTGEVGAVLELAEKVDARDKVQQATGRQLADHGGVKASWLQQQVRRLMAKIAEQEAAATAQAAGLAVPDGVLEQPAGSVTTDEIRDRFQLDV